MCYGTGLFPNNCLAEVHNFLGEKSPFFPTLEADFLVCASLDDGPASNEHAVGRYCFVIKKIRFRPLHRRTDTWPSITGFTLQTLVLKATLLSLIRQAFGKMIGNHGRQIKRLEGTILRVLQY